MRVWRIRYGHEQTVHEILMLVTHWVDDIPHGYQVWGNPTWWDHYKVDDELTSIHEGWTILSTEPIGVVSQISLTERRGHLTTVV